MGSDQSLHTDGEDAWLHHIRDDDDAFGHFFKAHFNTLCAWCQYRFGFDPDMAKEAVHSSFIKLWKTRANLDARLPVKAYLYKIIVNTSLDMIKGAKNRGRLEQYMQQHDIVDDASTSVDAFDTRQLQAAIDKAIAALPEQMRLVFELSRYEGLKYADIARELNISVNTVETQMTRALKKLREKLSGYLAFYAELLIISLLLKK